MAHTDVSTLLSYFRKYLLNREAAKPFIHMLCVQGMDEEEGQIVVDPNNSFQTVTLVPSEVANGEVSYVLVVQEDSKPVIKLDQV